ncbi:MAG: hypothetical protein IT307_09905 [Chloroflexi bacterium]|nr:hypothetical protein [Chloroflexota bacterium]
MSTSQTGRVVIKARARDTADHIAETQQAFRVVAEPTATPTVPAPTTLPAPTTVPATPTIAPTPTVQDLTVRVPALGAHAAATPATPPSPAVAAPTARSAEPAPILAERTRPVLQPPAPRAASAQPQDVAPPASTVTAVPSKEPTTTEQFAARALAAANGARARAGALPLLRHSALDTSAGAHAQYASASNDSNLNGEMPGSDLFTGETPAIRVTRANTGRPPALSRVGEVMSLGEPDPERIVAGWLASVYHRAVLLDLAAQFGGFGRRSDDASANAVLDLAGRRDLSSAVGRYPGDGQSGVPIGCVCDDYAVASDRTGPFGFPVTLLLGGATPGGQLSARLYENNGADVEVPVDLVDAFGQPTIVPRAPLKPNTRYTARFQWSGGPDLRWSFTTAQ